MKKKYLGILTLILISFLTKESIANTSLYGDEGYISTPSSEVIPERNINLGMSYLPGERSYTRTGEPNLVYSLALSFFPRTEVGLVFNQIFTGKADRDNPYLTTSFFDRSIFAKVQILEEDKYIPSLSIGGRDIISNGVVNPRDVFTSGNATSSHQQIFYLAVGKKFFDYKINLGYSYAPGVPLGFVDSNSVEKIVNLDFRINGFFAAIETPRYFNHISGIIEFDSKYLNYGLDIGNFYGFYSKVVMIDLIHPNVRFGWTARL